MKGTLIAFEGLDGAGKGTQLALLLEGLKSRGIRTEQLSFPRYGKSFYADMAAMYLRGDFGDPASISPYFSSLPYALDRIQARDTIIDWLKGGAVVLVDRYVPSNLAHQSAKLPPEGVPPFLEWLTRLEYEVNGLPRADLTVFLRIPPSLAYERVGQKKRRSYTRQKRDVHERDLLYQVIVDQRFVELSQTLPGWVTVECVSRGGALLPPQAVAADVLKAVTTQLPPADSHNLGQLLEG